MIFAIFLILIGFIWLLYNLGIITTSVAQVIWPLMVIAIGLALLIKSKNHHFGHWCCGWHNEDKNKKEEK